MSQADGRSELSQTVLEPSPNEMGHSFRSKGCLTTPRSLVAFVLLLSAESPAGSIMHGLASVQQSACGSVGHIAPHSEMKEQQTINGCQQSSGGFLPLISGHVHPILHPVEPAMCYATRRGRKGRNLRGGLTQDLHIQPQHRLYGGVACGRP